MKILLFSDNENVQKKTKQILGKEFDLIWRKYNHIYINQYPIADIVIIHFDRKRIMEGTNIPIIKVKGKLGKDIPILAIINGTPQQIFSVLKVGVYDYITTVEDTQVYKNKLKAIVLWKRYRDNYGLKDEKH